MTFILAERLHGKPWDSFCFAEKKCVSRRWCHLVSSPLGWLPRLPLRADSCSEDTLLGRRMPSTNTRPPLLHRLLLSASATVGVPV